MTDEENPPAPEPVGIPDAPPKRSKLRKWLIISVLAVILVPTVALTIWSWVALSYSYSDGLRSGYVQKFSKKGWICKTWEGELAQVNIPGAAQERWLFSVRDDSVASIIDKAMGQQVTLHYEEKRGIPTSCFGETNYFVNEVRPISNPMQP